MPKGDSMGGIMSLVMVMVVLGMMPSLLGGVAEAAGTGVQDSGVDITGVEVAFI